MTRHDMTRRVEDTVAVFGEALVDLDGAGGHRFTIPPHQAYDAIGAHAAVTALTAARPATLVRANEFAGAVPDDRAFYRPFIERWSAA